MIVPTESGFIFVNFHTSFGYLFLSLYRLCNNYSPGTVTVRESLLVFKGPYHTGKSFGGCFGGTDESIIRQTNLNSYFQIPCSADEKIINLCIGTLVAYNTKDPKSNPFVGNY